MMKLKELYYTILNHQTITLLDSYTGEEIKCSDKDAMNMLVTEVVATSQDHLNIKLYTQTPGFLLVDVLLLTPNNTIIKLDFTTTGFSETVSKYNLMRDAKYNKYLTAPVLSIKPVHDLLYKEMLCIECDISSIYFGEEY